MIWMSNHLKSRLLPKASDGGRLKNWVYPPVSLSRVPESTSHGLCLDGSDISALYIFSMRT